MKITLPDSLKRFVDEQVTSRGYGTSSEYVRELIQKDQERLRLRNLLLQGQSSPSTTETTNTYFDELRNRVRRNICG